MKITTTPYFTPLGCSDLAALRFDNECGVRSKVMNVLFLEHYWHPVHTAFSYVRRVFVRGGGLRELE